MFFNVYNVYVPLNLTISHIYAVYVQLYLTKINPFSTSITSLHLTPYTFISQL